MSESTNPLINPQPEPENPSTEIPSNWLIKSAEQIMQEPSQTPDWIINDLLLKDSGTLVSGHPHSCKSLHWLCAALESVTTHKVWNYFDAPNVNRVLYVETEDPRMVVENRIRQFGHGLNITADQLKDRFYLAVTGPFDLLKSASELQALVEQIEPDWMVLSTLQGLLNGVDWKEQSAMGPINAIMVRLSRICPLVLITHSPWDKAQKRAAGSVTQAANFLTTVHFEKNNNGRSVSVNLDSKLGNEVPTFNLNLNTEIVRGVSEVRRVCFDAPKLKTRIIDYLARHPEATPAEVAEVVGCSDRYVRDLIKDTKTVTCHKSSLCGTLGGYNPQEFVPSTSHRNTDGTNSGTTYLVFTTSCNQGGTKSGTSGEFRFVPKSVPNPHFQRCSKANKNATSEQARNGNMTNQTESVPKLPCTRCGIRPMQPYDQKNRPSCGLCSHCRHYRKDGSLKPSRRKWSRHSSAMQEQRRKDDPEYREHHNGMKRRERSQRNLAALGMMTPAPTYAQERQMAHF